VTSTKLLLASTEFQSHLLCQHMLAAANSLSAACRQMALQTRIVLCILTIPVTQVSRTKSKVCDPHPIDYVWTKGFNRESLLSIRIDASLRSLSYHRLLWVELIGIAVAATSPSKSPSGNEGTQENV
jgi:hypothetical protein